MSELHDPKPLYEKLYKVNVLPDGNLKSVNLVDEVFLRMPDSSSREPGKQEQEGQIEKKDSD
jgi:hypothetical protein